MSVGCARAAISVAVVCVGALGCGSGSVSPSGFLPPEIEGTVVGEIIEIGEDLTPLGPRPGVLDVFVEKRPLATAGSCPRIFFSVRVETQVAIWRRAEEIRAGTVADLAVGAIVRVQKTADPCFGSCQGPCTAGVVQVFVD